MNQDLEAENKKLKEEITDAYGIIKVLWDQLDEPWPRLLNWLERNQPQTEK